ncbi:MAG: hypothetical protein NC904_01105 [Candidatus Omnitrophica bacterium]|nr:hypothetical protein [Candidatus Omnitrophota bacterium]
MGDIRLKDEEIREGAPWGAISYVFFLWVITFIYKKDNAFAYYHAKQGLVIFICEFICFFLPIIPFIGQFFFRIGLIICLIFSVYGLYSSLTGKLCRIPIISEIASKFVI